MRVLDTSTQTLVEFANPPDEYAILSHTWANEEVTFEDITGDKKYWKDGWDKIIHCCKLAASDGWQYVWIDTCCIDKSSSADLSEAINSMFTWYANASICYAYLADVSDLNLKAREQQITMSRWFTRGWTLQELIAPKFIIFLNRMWQEIGTRDSLASAIEKATQMTRTDLRNWKTCSLATKMSWAARRTTLRIEDEAYCLMGLFGINMPLLYGEGPKAFLRLQHEIIKTSDDESIFAWKDSEFSLKSYVDGSMYISGPFASSPRHFADAGGILPLLTVGEKTWTPDYAMTNKGLNINLALYKQKGNQYRCLLNCRHPCTGQRIGIYLSEDDKGLFTRFCPQELWQVDPNEYFLLDDPQMRRLYIRQPEEIYTQECSRTYSLFFRCQSTDWSLSHPLQARKALNKELVTFTNTSGCVIGSVESGKVTSREGINMDFSSYGASDPAVRQPESNTWLLKLPNQTRRSCISQDSVFDGAWHMLFMKTGTEDDALYVMIAVQQQTDGFVNLDIIQHKPVREVHHALDELRTRNAWAEEASVVMMLESGTPPGQKGWFVGASLRPVPTSTSDGDGTKTLLVDISCNILLGERGD